MLTGLTHTHSFLRWVILILLVVSLLKAFQGRSRGGEFHLKDGKFFMLTMVATHIQVLIGLILYFISPKVEAALNYDGGMMKNAVHRFWGMEHAFGMIVAIVLITIGYSSSKKITDTVKRYSKVAWFYLIAFLIIIITIPWPFRHVGIDSFF